MKRKLLIFCCAVVFATAWSALRQAPNETVVVVTASKQAKPHIINESQPEALYSTSSVLRVGLDANHYASYTVTLTAPDGSDTTVVATSSTVAIPITGDGDTYVITVDGGDSYSLTETGVSEPAEYEWLDTGMNTLDRGRSVTLSRSEAGEYCVLRVTYAASGLQDYAVAALDGAPSISGVSPVPFEGELTVGLTGPATAGMAVSVIPVAGGPAALRAAVPEGAVSITLSAASLPAGQYAVCLTRDGEVLQSVSVVK